MEIKIEGLTIGQAKALAAMFPQPGITGMPSHPYPVGSNVFIRTVTMHYTGKLVQVYAGELVLEDAAWVADSGRFHEALMSGKLNEVEPFPAGRVIIPRDGIIDVSLWGHTLPRDPK